ncbi:MAG: CoA transferase [Chloroflexi bacterium]|nr:CoA transferase [Chloroflexota bacterium]MYE40169.1 CoA transferase [Chloroflexota bacterium]
MNGLLEGIRALDLTHYFAGPYCTRLLAGLGAEVVKVERPPLGDPLRGYGPFASRPVQARSAESDVPMEDGAWHLYLNASKRSIGLDIKTDEGRETLLQLAAQADVLVENFAPGTLGRLGLGYEELRRANPALVVTSISNFGQTGPYRDWKAAEVNLYAMGGLMNITGEPDREPLKEGVPLAQLGAGQNAFVATMAALMYAEETGEGQQIDISIAEYATNILENALMQYSYSGQEYTRVGNRGYGRAAWGIYPCRDGFVGIIAGPDHRWPEVARIMERDELADPRFSSRRGRQDNADEVDALMLPWLIEHDKVDIFKAGQESGLGFSFVATMEDILEMEQLLYRDYFVELEHPTAGGLRYPGAPISCEPDANAWVFGRAPLYAEHTRQVLSDWLGFDAARLSELAAAGAFGGGQC